MAAPKADICHDYFVNHMSVKAIAEKYKYSAAYIKEILAWGRKNNVFSKYDAQWAWAYRTVDGRLEPVLAPRKL